MTHQISGVGAAALTAAAVDAPVATAAVLVGTAWFGSMLPDADKAGSHIHRPTAPGRRHLPVVVAGTFGPLRLRLLSLLPHRGVTHAVAACAVVGALAGALVSL